MNQSGKPAPEDEFDLEELASKLFRLIRKFFAWLFAPLIRLFVNWKLALGAAVAGILAGIFLYGYLPSVYTSAITLKPTDKADLSFFTHTHVLSQSISRGETATTATLLGCSPEFVSKIAQVEMEPVWKNKEKKDTVNSLTIEAKVLDPLALDSLQIMLLRYLETTPYYARIRQVRENQVRQTLEKLQSERQEIDSMKRMMMANMEPRSAGGFVYGEPLNPVRLYEEALSLYKTEIGLKSQLLYLDNFQVVNGFTPVSKPSGPLLIILLPFCIGLFVVLAVVINEVIRSRKNKEVVLPVPDRVLEPMRDTL